MSDWATNAAKEIGIHCDGSVCLEDKEITAIIRKHYACASDFVLKFLEWLEIENPCTKCSGRGKRAYGSTATWRGGIGGQVITTGVCDHCWGSGDENNKWPSWKKYNVARTKKGY